MLRLKSQVCRRAVAPTIPHHPLQRCADVGGVLFDGLKLTCVIFSTGSLAKPGDREQHIQELFLALKPTWSWQLQGSKVTWQKEVGSVLRDTIPDNGESNGQDVLSKLATYFRTIWRYRLELTRLATDRRAPCGGPALSYWGFLGNKGTYIYIYIYIHMYRDIYI